MNFKGTIIITDPVFIVKEEDWEKSNFGKTMENIGFKNCMTRDNLDVDWICETINLDNGKKIGEFSADAGMVGVFLLEEVLKYNKDFNYHIDKPWTTTLIENFQGTVEFTIVPPIDDGVDYNAEESLAVVGKGNINFIGQEKRI